MKTKINIDTGELKRKYNMGIETGKFKYKYDIGDTVVELGFEQKPFTIWMRDQYLITTMTEQRWKAFYRGGINYEHFRRLRDEDDIRLCRMVIVEKTIMDLVDRRMLSSGQKAY